MDTTTENRTPDTWQARQGDVLLIRVEETPEGLIAVPLDKGRIVLAYGEATGHAHAITVENTDEAVATLFERSGVEDRFLVVEKEALLTHEEHGTVTIPPGTYTVRQQRQMNMKDARGNPSVRRVRD